MKRYIWMLILIALAAPAWASKKTTIQELQQMLISLQQEKKSDGEVATQLKEVELSEELTASTKETLMQYAPGPLTGEQMDILEGRSAILAPPRSDIPTTAAPDIAGQKAILARCVDYVTNVYMHNPRMSASKTTSRYQDGVENIHTNSGMTSNMPNTNRIWDIPNKYLRFLGTHTAPVELEKGVELIPAVKQEAPWGQNGQISEGGPGPVLSVILQEAAAAGRLNWLRWEMVRGHLTAVFSFEVPKKKSHYEVHYCCFPITQDTGRMGYEGTTPNLQFGTTWKDFKSIVGYHGEFFIEPDTGTIVRVITVAELKPTDFVHREDMRIDYEEALVDGKPYMLPAHSFTITEVVPNGDNYAAVYSIRHTLFKVSFSDYRLTGANQEKDRGIHDGGSR